MALPIINSQAREFTTTSGVAVTSSSDWVRICQITPKGHKVIFCGEVGPDGALGHLRVTQAATDVGVHNTLVEDTGLNAATDAIPYCIPTNAYITAASGTFQFLVDSGAVEVSIWAKKASDDTTLKISGSIL